MPVCAATTTSLTWPNPFVLVTAVRWCDVEQEYAIRTVAKAAKSSASRLKLLHEGGVGKLVDYLREFMHDPDMMEDSLMLALMHGLLNLSTEPDIQVCSCLHSGVHACYPAHFLASRN